MQLAKTYINSSFLEFDEGTFTGHIPELYFIIDDRTDWVDQGFTIIGDDEELVFEFVMAKTCPFPNYYIRSWHFACVTHDRGHLKAEIFP